MQPTSISFASKCETGASATLQGIHKDISGWLRGMSRVRVGGMGSQVYGRRLKKQCQQQQQWQQQLRVKHFV